MVVANLLKTDSERKSLKKYCKLRILTIHGVFSSWKRKKLIKNILRALHRFPHVENALQRWYCWNQGGGLFTMDRFVWKIAFMFCPHCLQSMHVPTKFECFICLESIRNKFMPLGKDLLAAKLNYLQRAVVVKKMKKSGKIWYNGEKSPPNIFFLIRRGYFDQKLPEEFDKNGPDALKRWT